MRSMTVIAPALAVMLLTTVEARACNAIVVNAQPNETIAYTCWAANLTTVDYTPAPLPKYEYKTKKTKKPTKKKKKCRKKRCS